MEQWRITPGHESTVQTFLENLGTRDREKDQYGCCVQSFPESLTFNGDDLHSELMNHYTPTTMNLLRLEMNKDYYFEEYPNLDEMVIEVRSLFVYYIKAMKEKPYQFGNTVEFFVLLFRYNVLFTNYKSHGLHHTLKELTCLLLDTLYEHSALPLFLIFCEFYPEMVTANYFPICRRLSADSVNQQVAFIQTNFDYLSLFIKHQAKWKPFFDFLFTSLLV